MDRGKTCNLLLEGILHLYGRTCRGRTVGQSEGKLRNLLGAGDVTPENVNKVLKKVLNRLG